jgi:hypothetical protein
MYRRSRRIKLPQQEQESINKQNSKRKGYKTDAIADEINPNPNPGKKKKKKKKKKGPQK